MPTVWFITRSDVTVEQAAAARPAPAAEPQEPEETSFWSPDAEVKASPRADHAPVELGMRFTAAQSGVVTGVRFYKARGDKGRHTGSLWNADGERLAGVTFAGESASGWQEARFASPVRLTAEEPYTVSYHSEDGNYVGTKGFDAARSGPLATTSRGAGVFGYGQSSFPRRSHPRGYNYWVDVIFRWHHRPPSPVPTGPPASAPPTSAPPTESPDGTPSTGTTTGPDRTAEPDAGPGPTRTADPEATPGQTDGPGPSATPGPSRTPEPSATPDPTGTPGPTGTGTPDPKPTGTPTPTGTSGPKPTGTPRPSATGTDDPGPAPTKLPTPKPTPKPTLTAGPTPTPEPDGKGCPAYPTPACTGVPPGTKLAMSALNEDGAAYRVTTPGAELNGVHIPGDLLINANGVKVRNSQIDGRVINADGDDTFSFTITDSTIGTAKRCQTLPGIGQDKYTATRVLIRGHGDGFRAAGDDIVIRDSYVDLCSNPGDHSDGIQTYNTGKGLIFDHNTVDQRHAKDITAPIFLVDKQIVDAVITDNLVMGGTYSIQLRNGRGNLVMRGNKLVDKSWVYGPVEADCAKIDWADNSLVTIDANYRITSTVGPLPCMNY
ncbi:DUF4082 domain-containing protein [Streptosporangium sp. NBC_01756]|uniref:DUF4082 domain-containing protein n=1 Tax=Streptosporangium sp. NBC_01756 TaxID=2975950 RepID=UPI002DD80F8D|nr:DUF4082 domain-containing protein [Streptosporangium sp. NBC_01756]WSC83129.1 DUF4082 domain-containing protein [Streptosporangium sp. NBC_01756]